jgi:putative oxidoreductase
MQAVKQIKVSIVLLRLMVGFTFAMHSFQKLFGAFGGSGINGFAKMLNQLGFTPGVTWAWVVAVVELLAGLFLIAGLWSRLSAAFIGIIMLVAIFKVHLSGGFFAANGGFEYPLLILVCCISIILGNGGKLQLTANQEQ